MKTLVFKDNSLLPKFLQSFLKYNLLMDTTEMEINSKYKVIHKIILMDLMMIVKNKKVKNKYKIHLPPK